MKIMPDGYTVPSDLIKLDVTRCAGRLEHLKRYYLHSTNGECPEEEPEDDSDTLSDREDIDSDNDSTKCLKSTLQQDLRDKKKLERRLAKLVIKLLEEKTELSYYQGFHDVCLTFMTLYGEEEALERLRKVVDSHFSIHMQPTMAETQEFLALLPIIIELRDPELSNFLEQSEVGQVFALSWVITWFSHEIPYEQDVKIIFSTLPDHDPHLILYLIAEIVLSKSREIKKLNPEMSEVYQFLSQVPRTEKLSIEKLLIKSFDAIEEWPPELIKRKLVLKRRRLLVLKFSRNCLEMFPRLRITRSRIAFTLVVLAFAYGIQRKYWS